ncbi:MAG: flagellar biosynthetic protein FliO [Ancalomicrobiaceae bacterium]|nr:flagellar biosynthetic protein FliO [Ancalomicrobiaceae bacterium]
MRELLNSILGQDAGQVAQFVIALILVVILIVLVAWVIGRFATGSLGARKGSTKGRSRLAVTDASDVDGHRRLVLVRRDDVEHLIMIGGPNDLLIESRIMRQPTTGVRVNPQQTQRPAAPSPQELLAAAPPVPPVGAQPAPVPAAPHRTPTQMPQIESFDDASPTRTPTPTEPPVARRPDLKPPTLGNLLHAATSVAAVPPAATPAPVAAAPSFEPPRMPTARTQPPPHRFDDREAPTEMVPPPARHSAAEFPQPPYAGEPKVPTYASEQRERVSNQIEQALSALANEPTSAPRQPVPEPTALRPSIRHDAAASQQPALQEFEASVLMPAVPVAPQRETAAPTRPVMPPVPQRPTPVPRAPLSGQTSPLQPHAVAEPVSLRPEPDTTILTQRPAIVASAPRPQPIQPVTAPRPVTGIPPFGGPVGPAPVTAPQADTRSEAKQKSDELEEEMAKLLSELGRPPSR